ncbi:FadR family transcriptional regulator [Saccharopolyspora sp. HNM0983]|uniref:FadR family transcriptional regulator n=1 Tax=Saccharopolyspora montiporae TaxID=2781240 RepID=A0A929BAF8_9PSEU|nr:FCD domain-containing protein [Saccharopolyspora sp. HNM0983]MBE9376289.1 FadR family transcriptional regulator [Saccharopolyspora sp. HNM0983]
MAGFAADDGDQDGSAWRPLVRAHTYELVVERIEEQILDGTLRVGDRLPAERDLAGMLGISRSAVREALRALQAQGVLRMAVGTGPDSGTTVAAMPSQALTRLLRLHVGLANFPLRDVVEARVALERASARSAALAATDADLAELRDLLDRMDDPDQDRDRFNELDTDFHVAIAEASGNRLVADMTIAIRESLRCPLQQAFRDLGDSWGPIAEVLREDHRGVLRALADRDPQQAEQRMEAHIRGFYARIPEVAGPDARTDPRG